MEKVIKSFAIAVLLLGATACGSKEAPQATTNPAYDAIMTRSSVRSYTDQKISADTIELLLKAAMAAPTARDQRPWHFVVLQGERLKQVADSMEYRESMAAAPLGIMVCGNTTKFFEGEGRDFWVQDVSAATENLLLAAHALGLGAVWTGVYPLRDRTVKMIECGELAENLMPLAVVLVGYPSGEPTIKDKWDPNNVTYLE